MIDILPILSPNSRTGSVQIMPALMESEYKSPDTHTMKRNQNVFTFQNPIGTTRFIPYITLYKPISAPVRKHIEMDRKTKSVS